MVKDTEIEIPLRITLYRVPPGVRFALQKGKSDAKGNAELVAPTRSDPTSLSFDFSVRVARGNSGAYSAAKFALAGWTDALHIEERPHGVHVGLVLPGFVVTEGFPQKELVDNRRTRWIVSTPEKVADAIWEAGPGGKAERYVPRPYALAAALRVVAPRLTRRVLSGDSSLTPSTTAK